MSKNKSSTAAFGPITISSTNLKISNGAGFRSVLPVHVSGGLKPFRYSIVSGPGEIDSETGLYTQPASWEPTVVKITDAAGQSVLINISNETILVDGPVHAMGIDGDSLFLAGDFDLASPVNNLGFAFFDQTTGSASSIESAPCNYKARLHSDSETGTALAAIQIGDDLIIGGNFSDTTFNGIGVSSLFKFNLETCSLDTLFNEKAKTILGTVYTISFDSAANRLYVGGELSSYDGRSIGNILKIDASSGDIDSVFHQSTGFDLKVRKILLKNNSVYAGGAFSNYRGFPAQRLAKIEKISGNIDQTFTQSTGLNTEVYDLIILNDSLFAGVSSISPVYRGVSTSQLIKVNLDTGNLDTTFSNPSGFGFPRKVLSLATDGIDIFVGGEFSSYRGVACPRVIKLSGTNGDMITGFNWGTGATGGAPFNVYFDSEAQELIIGTGAGQSYNGSIHKFIIRVDKDTGVIDPSFNSELVYSEINSILNSVTFLSGSRFLVLIEGSGTHRGTKSRKIAKFNMNTWTIDSQFIVGEGFNDRVNSIIVVGNYLYFGGLFTTYNGQPARGLAKVDKLTGALDTTFTQATGIAAGTVYTEVNSMHSDGSNLYICGDFQTYRGSNARYLARVSLSTGNLETTFTQSTGLNAVCRSIVFTNSSIYITGEFTSYRGSNAWRLAKVNPTNGNLDATFTSAASGLNGGYGGSIQTDGSDIFVCGDFTHYRGASLPYLIKVHKDTGAVDATFTQIPSLNLPCTIAGIVEGKVYLGNFGISGSITSYRGSAVKDFFAVSAADGLLDQSFNSTVGLQSHSSPIIKVVKKHNDKLFLGGSFYMYRGKKSFYFNSIDQLTGN